jgi:hypothetical protein
VHGAWSSFPLWGNPGSDIGELSVLYSNNLRESMSDPVSKPRFKRKDMKDMRLYFRIMACMASVMFLLLPSGLCATSTYVCDGVDAQAYEGADTDGVFAGGSGAENEISAGDYTNLASDDDNYVLDSANTDYQYHRFVFSIAEEVSNITQIDITWKGFGLSASIPVAPVAPSFTGDTLIETARGRVSFEDLFGMYSREEELPGIQYFQNGTTFSGRIKAVHRYAYIGEVLILTFANGASVKVTPHHELLTDGTHDIYTQAGYLDIGAYVIGTGGDPVAVVAIDRIDHDGYVYDITVKEFHNYLLTAGIFVHNLSGHSLWVKESGAWTEKDSGVSGEKETLSAQYTSGFSDIIDAGELHIAAQSDVIDEAISSRLYSYYVEVMITYTEAAQPITTRIGRSGFRINKGTSFHIRR